MMVVGLLELEGCELSLEISWVKYGYSFQDYERELYKVGRGVPNIEEEFGRFCLFYFLFLLWSQVLLDDIGLYENLSFSKKKKKHDFDNKG